jgi:PEP-CTERM motif
MLRPLLSALLIALAASTTAYATPFFTHYTVNMDKGSLGVVGIVKFESTANGGGSSFPDQVDGDGSTTIIDQVFGSSDLRTQGLLMGLSIEDQQVPNFAASDTLVAELPPVIKHVVMFMSVPAAQAADGVDFSNLFSNFAEADVISWLQIVGIDGVAGVGQLAFDEAFTLLQGFADGAHEMFDPSNESVIDAWFDIPVAGPDGLPFSVVSFTAGSLVGNGVVTQTDGADGATVPEPTSLSLLGLGFAGIGFARKLKAKAA